MNNKYKKQTRVAMAVALAATSIGHSTTSIFAQSEDAIKEEVPVQVTEESIKEEIPIQATEEKAEEVVESVVKEELESKESIQHVEKAVGDVAIDATNFPDSTFRNYISTNFDVDKDSVLSGDEIANITRIDVKDNKSITSVQGIEHFPNLTYLDCANTGITSIDVSKNLMLDDLRVYDNQGLTSLDVSKNTALRALYCYITGITSIDVSKNPELEIFNCRNANVTSVDVSNNPKLNILIVTNNPGITSLDVTKNPLLETLFCGNTGIKSLDVRNNPALDRLHCFSTGITSLDVTNNTVLTNLNCDNLGITSLDLSNNLKLASLRCQNTGMTNLDVRNNTKLAWLYVGNSTNLNVTKSNSVIDLNGIENTFNIKEIFLDIDVNRVQSISGASLDKNTGIVSGYTYGTPITYTYNCGTSRNGALTLQVTLNVKGQSSIAINDNLDKVYDGIAIADPISITKIGSNGAVSFEWYKADDTKLQTAPTEAGDYKVKAILAEDHQYISAEVEKEFTITKADSTIAINGNLGKVYDGLAVSEPQVSVTGSTGTVSTGIVSFEWYTANDTQLQTAPTDAGDYKVKAILADDANHIGAEVVQEFTITKASSTITINDDLNKTYDGTAVANPTDVETTGSTGAVSFEWYTENDTQLQQAPTEAGNYKVKAILAEDGNHDGVEAVKAFEITKATSTITIDDDLNKVYDGQAVVEPQVTVTGSTGAVTFKWYMADDTPLLTAPVNIGNYKVKAILEDDANHIGAEVEKEFTIGKAASTITINDDLNKVYDGQAVVEPTDIVTTGSTGAVTFEWYTADGTLLTSAPVNAGSYKVKAILAGDGNYAGIEVEKEFIISQASSNVTITVELDKVYDGQPVVEPQVSVTGSTGAITYEWYKKEESATRAATWTQLTEAPREVGSYKVVVTVAGDENFEAVTVEKEFSISGQATVAPGEGEGTTTIPGQEVTGVQTGDGTQVGLWTMLVGLSTGIMMFFRRKNRKEEV